MPEPGAGVLLAAAMRTLHARGRVPVPRWVAVRDTFAVGSTSAKALCTQFGVDPDALVAGCRCQADEDDA